MFRIHRLPDRCLITFGTIPKRLPFKTMEMLEFFKYNNREVDYKKSTVNFSSIISSLLWRLFVIGQHTSTLWTHVPSFQWPWFCCGWLLSFEPLDLPLKIQSSWWTFVRIITAIICNQDDTFKVAEKNGFNLFEHEHEYYGFFFVQSLPKILANFREMIFNAAKSTT